MLLVLQSGLVFASRLVVVVVMSVAADTVCGNATAEPDIRHTLQLDSVVAGASCSAA
jgi:hypothetical protein